MRLRQLLTSKGYDGIVYENTYEGPGDSWIVFRPTQIKSATSNIGTWDPDDPDIRRNPGSVTLAKVIDNLKETDMTGDPEWIKDMINKIRRFKVWNLGVVDLQDIENYCSDDVSDLASEWSEAVPPIVLVPTKGNGEKKWDIVDGSHRAAAAESLGKKKITAYYPDIKNNPEGGDFQSWFGTLELVPWKYASGAAWLDTRGELRGNMTDHEDDAKRIMEEHGFQGLDDYQAVRAFMERSGAIRVAFDGCESGVDVGTRPTEAQMYSVEKISKWDPRLSFAYDLNREGDLVAWGHGYENFLEDVERVYS